MNARFPTDMRGLGGLAVFISCVDIPVLSTECQFREGAVVGDQTVPSLRKPTFNEGGKMTPSMRHNALLLAGGLAALATADAFQTLPLGAARLSAGSIPAAVNRLLWNLASFLCITLASLA